MKLIWLKRGLPESTREEVWAVRLMAYKGVYHSRHGFLLIDYCLWLGFNFSIVFSYIITTYGLVF